jgi:HD-GYP domain-containing protein (c-di-GMP phosphodiesterase class II)
LAVRSGAVRADEEDVNRVDWRDLAGGAPEAVRALTEAVEAGGDRAVERAERVGVIATAIAARLGLAESLIDEIAIASKLQEVGMSAVPEAILSKEGPLTASEMAEVKRHPEVGQELVDAAGMPELAAWIRHHHERWDGNGYPDGLSGPEIPIESRILAISAALAAMTAERPYRSAMGAEMATLEIKASAGTQFDPGIARIVIALLERHAFAEDADVPDPVPEQPSRA